MKQNIKETAPQTAKKPWISVFIFTAAAILCEMYGVLVRRVGSGTGFYLVWVMLGILCFLTAGMIWSGIWKKVPLMIRRILIILLSLVFCSFLMIEGMILGGFHKDIRSDVDYLLILGAQVHQSGPSTVLRYRLDKAVTYLTDHPETICIVSGGQGSNEPFPEAEGMADYLIQNGIPEARIRKETQSRTTEENISFSMQYFKKSDSVGLVTNNFHVFRALQTAEDQGLTNVRGLAAPSTVLYLPNNLLREYLGEMKFLCMRLIR